MRPSAILLPTAAAALLAGCTPQQGAPSASAASDGGGQCFRAQEVNGFHPIDRDTVDVIVGVNHVYRLELLTHCREINWSQRIALVSRGSSWICTGRQAELIVPTPTGPDRCLVNSVGRLSEAEAEAARRARN